MVVCFPAVFTTMVVISCILGMLLCLYNELKLNVKYFYPTLLKFASFQITFAFFMRGPKLNSIPETSAREPKLVVFIETGFETYQNVYILIF